MAERLYLIRINLESFLGPFTAHEVRKAYKRMEFGLQDEIAASNRDWVAFDDFLRMKKIYPELFDLIKKDMLSGWGQTAIQNAVEVSRPSSQRSRPRNRWLGRSFFVLTLITAGGGGYYLAKQQGLASKIMGQMDPNTFRASEFLDDAKSGRFDAYIEKHRSEIIGEVRNRRSYDDWIPYVRAYAFARNGQFEGLDHRFLRGNTKGPAPKECTAEGWKKIWLNSTGSEWERFISGQKFPDKEWAKLLVWDPHWIKMHEPGKGWQRPGSYYEACLVMALKAFNMSEVEAIGNKESRSVINSRLRWLINQLQEEGDASEYSMSGGLWALSCLESAEKITDVDGCQDAFKLTSAWLKVVSNRSLLAKARLLTLGSKTVKGAQMDLFRALIEGVKNPDPSTDLDYTPELRLYQQILVNGGSVSKAVAKVRVTYPEVSYRGY